MSNSSTLLDSAGLAQFRLERVTLADALHRFEREAVRGMCDTGRYHCSYYTWGSGPPLLLIPGISDDALSFVMPCSILAEHFRCIAYDLPTGWGDRARLRRYTHAQLVEDVFALLDHLGAEQSYLFGSSFGGTIALRAMDSRPERLPRGVLQGGFAYRPLGFVEYLQARIARWLPGRRGSDPLRPAVLRRVHHGPFADREPDVWRFFLTRWGRPPFTVMSHRALMMHHLDLRSLLPEIEQPVLLVCGDVDPLVSKECEETLLNGLPNAGRIELNNCGHNPLFTHPEVLAEVVRRFLTPPACMV
jgi:pimeloyl-ACP methyl ester carboxylesterase